MRDMVARATDPSVGLVHQMPYIWVPPSDATTYDSYSSCPSGSTSFGSSMERIYFSSSLARPYLALGFMGITCFTGMSYVFRKAVMEQAGGLRNFGHYLAEDFQLSAAINRLGYRHVISAYPAMQNNGPDLSLNTLKDRLVRWHRLRIHLMPFVTICLEPFQVICCSLLLLFLKFFLFPIKKKLGMPHCRSCDLLGPTFYFFD